MWLHAEIKTLGDIPRHYAQTLGDKPALIDAAGPVSFAALDARSNRIANVLIKLGIEPGARVAFLGKNSTRYFDVLFGVNKVGAALVPLSAGDIAVIDGLALPGFMDCIVLCSSVTRFSTVPRMACVSSSRVCSSSMYSRTRWE